MSNHYIEHEDQRNSFDIYRDRFLIGSEGRAETLGKWYQVATVHGQLIVYVMKVKCDQLLHLPLLVLIIFICILMNQHKSMQIIS